MLLPSRLAPWSRAAPVRDCTRCSNDSRDLAGEEGADVPREPPRRFRDRSPPAAAAAAAGGGGPLALPILPPVAIPR